MKFRRKRPRKQPRSVMSSPERVFGEPRDKTVETDIGYHEYTPAKPKQKKIKKRYGIKISYTSRFFKRVCDYKRWYATESQRDDALAGLKKSLAGRWSRVTEYQFEYVER